MIAGRTALFLGALLLGGGLLAGCTGDSAPDSGASSSAPSSGGSGGSGGGSSELAEAAEQVNQQYLTAPAPTPIASIKGTVRDGRGTDVPGTLDLLAVTAGPNSTAVRWRLSTDQPISSTSTNYYNRSVNRIPDTDAVALVAKQANLRSLPGIWELPGTIIRRDCTCAYNPRELGPAGVELSGLYPALPATVSEIELRVPGFKALTAPVTRN